AVAVKLAREILAAQRDARRVVRAGGGDADEHVAAADAVGACRERFDGEGRALGAHGRAARLQRETSGGGGEGGVVHAADYRAAAGDWGAGDRGTIFSACT